MPTLACYCRPVCDGCPNNELVKKSEVFCF
jgi:hypothetical protein